MVEVLSVTQLRFLGMFGSFLFEKIETAQRNDIVQNTRKNHSYHEPS